MRLRHRIRQFLQHLTARKASVDRETAQSILSEPLLVLFDTMSWGDQAHALAVLRALPDDRVGSPDLAQAALLHDVGKAHAKLTVWHRAICVTLGGVAPSMLQRLAVADSASWRYPFYVHLHHAEIGAQRCERAGCSQATVALVRHHGRRGFETPIAPELVEQLGALDTADSNC